MENANRLKTDPAYRSEHLKKSKVCTNANCANAASCAFAHDLSDYRVPECFYAEFCSNNNCTMFHPGRTTVDEYITRNNIVFREANPVASIHSRRRFIPPPGAFTRFCNLVEEGKPCSRETCTFAHGIDQLALTGVCVRVHDKDEKCELFHPDTCECCEEKRNGLTNDQNHYCKARLAIAEEMGYTVPTIMRRNHLRNIESYVKMYEAQQKMIDELREEEELLQDENIEEVCDILEKMGLANSEDVDFAENAAEFFMEQERINDQDYDHDGYVDAQQDEEEYEDEEEENVNVVIVY
jgi:predicted house-cleaning noncanonical NTP pyrophosphatase (MazG superfamily)